MAVYGNVNVKYAPCKSVAQLHSAADYILGKKKEQLSSSVIKTKSELYNAFGCNRDNFANSVLMTRKMHQKKYSRFFPRDILAQKLSISFHPEDNDKLTYAEAYKMAEDFAREFFWKKGFEVLFAVHVDTEHVHVHFLVNNCNQKDGSSFRSPIWYCEIATAPSGPRNDKSEAFAILTVACTDCKCVAGPGCPLPYNGGYHETAAGTGRQCLPEIATSAVGLLAMTHQGGAVVHQSTSAVELPCTRRSQPARGTPHP